jgi:hypothetical protein
VFIINDGTFIMSDGTISGNHAYNGGGVYVKDGTFTMNGGTISGNNGGLGGGVQVGVTDGIGIFTMNGGAISGNTAKYSTGNPRYGGGGGVDVWDGTFTMNGGTISGNKADTEGGGVYSSETFLMVTGIIYGTNEPNTALRNTGTTNAALCINSGIAEYGTFSGTTWNSNGSLSLTNNTIKVINGALQ